MRRLLIFLAVFGGYKVLMSLSYQTEIRAAVSNLNDTYALNLPESLVMSIVKTESSFDVTATGAAGEYGLMQVMPSTYTWIYGVYGFSAPSNPYDINANLLAGMLFLDWLYKNTGSWFAVIHAYNVGLSGYQSGSRNWEYFGRVMASWVMV